MADYPNPISSRGNAGPAPGDRTARIIALREEGYLLWEIAERVGVTKERVRQILSKAKAMGAEPGPPKQVVTRQASILLGMSLEMRPGSFKKLMAKFGVTPTASKRGRLYWAVEGLRNIEFPKCVVCGSPIPLSRYARSVTCSHTCSEFRRAQYPHRRKQQLASTNKS